MPYIDKDARRRMAAYEVPKTPGELNFLLTDIIEAYRLQKGTSYATINDILGALSGCEKEFYRRVAVPYEEDAIERNGDVYGESHTDRFSRG